jgi:Predicted membrane protein (DUF2142)
VRTRAPVLLGLAMTLLLAAWVMSTQPFGSPDEASHYLRALSIANGSLVGPKERVSPPGHTRAQLDWAAHDTRGVTVPPKLSPPNVACLDGKPDAGPSACLEATITGDYHPLPYLLPAAALLVSNDASTGLWLSRGASALECLVFILLAIALACSGSGFSLLGLLAAITPMVLFLCSVVNPNGLEVAAGLAFIAGLLRLSRDTAVFPRWAWAAIALSGVVAILAWQLGPVFVLVDLVVFALLLGGGGLATLASRGRLPVGATGASLGAALAIYLTYGISSGAFHSQVGFLPIFGSVHAGVDALGPALQHAVGMFGSLTVKLPHWMYWLWWTLVSALSVCALAVGPRRQRLTYAGAALGTLLCPVLFYAWVYRHSGFGLQGRYVLPLLALIPLLAGELIERSLALPRPSYRWILRAAVVAVAAFQLVAWWINARASAGRPHALFFQHHALWSPPLGWLPWTAAAAAGTLLLAGVGVLIGPRATARLPHRSASPSAPTGSAQRAPAPPA